MTATQKFQNPTVGIAFVLTGILAISINDMLIGLVKKNFA